MRRRSLIFKAISNGVITGHLNFWRTQPFLKFGHLIRHYRTHPSAHITASKQALPLPLTLRILSHDVNSFPPIILKLNWDTRSETADARTLLTSAITGYMYPSVDNLLPLRTHLDPRDAGRSLLLCLVQSSTRRMI